MNNDEFKKGLAYAFRLFKLRPRSTGELTEKLRLRDYDEEIVAKVVAQCDKAGFLDDRAFARVWLCSRLKKYGLRRVSRELLQKGIPKDLIDTVWEETRDDYDEEALVREIAMRRFGSREQKDVAPLKRKKRVMDYLARRGFNLGIINKVIRQL